MPISTPAMTMSLRSPALFLAIILLGACGDKPAPLNPPAASSTPAAGAAATSEADRPVKLAVVNFSPISTPAGTPFNVQRDGNSGISFELSRPAPAAEFKGWFDDKPLTGVVVSKTIVTATIPGDYLANAGSYPIALEVGGVRLPAGTFEVKAP